MKIREYEFVEQILRRLYQNRNYSWKEDLDRMDLPKRLSNPIERLFTTYVSRAKMDFLGHLRQVCIYLHRDLRVPEDVFQWVKTNRHQFGFNIGMDYNTVSAQPHVMTDVQDLQHDYVHALKRKHSSAFPDSVLYNGFGYESYISLQQKTMIHTLKEMIPGSTMLACLPTGSGKSLAWQYGLAVGKFSGTVIVIVPTNALATDHVKNDKDNLKNYPWIESVNYSSESYGNDEGKLHVLCEKIKDNQQFILYISPEGLTNINIKKALIESAERGNLSAVFIDEAHLVIDWGMKFRPEFQFLPGLLRQIKRNSGRKIYTVLLSATFTENDKNTLLELFGDEVVYEYRGDELRPEISYYRHHCKSEEERKMLLLRLLSVVPKPVIVYVGTVANSQIYEKVIKEAGFCRVAKFNGDTKESERERIISDWRNNKIDIMVATSAFGMGVDKSDVRTVITAYTPENISRFYQEVGRSGRDGYSSLSFVLFCPTVDKGLVDSNVDKKLISTENLWKRWEALQDKATVSKVVGENDCYILDTDTRHKDLEYELTGGYNSGWNDNVVSMLARAGFITVLDVWRKKTLDNHKAYFIKVRINDFDIWNNEKLYIKKIDEFREKEREELISGRETVKQLLETDEWGCYANAFKSVFLYAEKLCSGCPYCAKNGVKEYYDKSKQYLIAGAEKKSQKKYHYRNFASVLTDNKGISLIGYDQLVDNKDISILIQKLLVAEVNIFVFGRLEKIKFDIFNDYEKNDVFVLSVEQLQLLPDYFVRGIVAFFFEDDNEVNRAMLKYSKKFIRRNRDVKQIFIAPLDYYYEEEKRKLVDYVEDIKTVNTIIGEKSIC